MQPESPATVRLTRRQLATAGLGALAAYVLGGRLRGTAAQQSQAYRQDGIGPVLGHPGDCHCPTCKRVEDGKQMHA